MAPKPVPREKIPWFPTIDASACTGCRVCLEFCQHGVYAEDGASGRVEVRRPFECVVGCSNCQDQCPAAAISFPDMEAIAELIQKLRKGS